MTTAIESNKSFGLRELAATEMMDIHGGAQALFLPPPASARSLKLDPDALLTQQSIPITK